MQIFGRRIVKQNEPQAARNRSRREAAVPLRSRRRLCGSTAAELDMARHLGLAIKIWVNRMAQRQKIAESLRSVRSTDMLRSMD